MHGNGTFSLFSESLRIYVGSRHSLSRSNHGLLHFVVFVIYFIKLSHSFPKQCCNSQSVTVSELVMLDVRLLEGQGASFVLWPQCWK